MVTQTEAIVLNTIRYGDNSIIAKIYSKKFGLINIIASSGKKKGVKIKNYFHPLSTLKIAIYFKQKQNLHRLKEVDYIDKPTDNEFNVAISALKFFLAELLSKLIGEEETNEKLYAFIEQQVKLLNQLKKDYRYFHINFLHDLSAYLGIKPSF
jgi:DNA repair protein RecO (recombination protein O)